MSQRTRTFAPTRRKVLALTVASTAATMLLGSAAANASSIQVFGTSTGAYQGPTAADIAAMQAAMAGLAAQQAAALAAQQAAFQAAQQAAFQAAQQAAALAAQQAAANAAQALAAANAAKALAAANAAKAHSGALAAAAKAAGNATQNGKASAPVITDAAAKAAAKTLGSRHVIIPRNVC